MSVILLFLFIAFWSGYSEVLVLMEAYHYYPFEELYLVKDTVATRTNTTTFYFFVGVNEKKA